MNLGIKQTFFLGGVVLLASIGVAVYFMERTHNRETAIMLKSINHERAEMLDQLIELNSRSLQTFASDYSAWNEMAEFLKKQDNHWAEINIDASLVTFGAQAAWVLQLDGTLHYEVNRLPKDFIPNLPSESPDLIRLMGEKRHLHFFQRFPMGMLEIRTAPIQPSDDITRITPPLGWLVVARMWDNAYIQTLTKPMQSTASWQPPVEQSAAQAHVRLQREFNDLNGQIARVLYLDYQPVPLLGLIESNQQETYVLYIFGATMLSLTMLGISVWVIMPLRRLSHALEYERPELLGNLANNRSEFGRLAKLVELLYVQKNDLRQEVSARIKLEATLREKEFCLRHSIELVSRLARDLHDSVIQSIYAAGLGLEGVRGSLRAEPALAEKRLTASQNTLNETIGEVRRFITELEPDQSAAAPFSFSQALTALAQNLQESQSIPVQFTNDPQLLQHLSAEQEVQILKIAREAISNVLRHANAHSIHLSLQQNTASGATLEIVDDGDGISPAQQTNAGRGLRNLATRAQEIGGTLEIISSEGKGTRIILHFKPAFPRKP